MSEGTNVTVSEEAAQRILKLIEGARDANQYDMKKVGVRFGVYSLGSPVFQYEFTVEDQPTLTDHAFESHGVKIYVDPISVHYLKGAEIEWKEVKLEGEFRGGGMFRFKNQDAKPTDCVDKPGNTKAE